MEFAMLIIGENLHCSRVVKRGGVRCVPVPGGGARIQWPAADGAMCGFGVPAFCGGERVRHVTAATAVARAETAESATALAYLAYLARQQVEAGAAYLDLNVDAFAGDKRENPGVMAWLVEQVVGWVPTPVAIDSSDPAILQAGAEAAVRLGRAFLLNSASSERPEVIDLAASLNGAVLCSAAGQGSLPLTAPEKVAALQPLVERARRAGLADDSVYLDALVLPVGTEPQGGVGFLEGCRLARQTFGPGVHLSGGISNVSFGMPERRLLNQLFLELVLDAGLDAPLIDPLQLAPQPFPEAWRTAARAVLLGTDEFAAEFLALVREGR